MQLVLNFNDFVISIVFVVSDVDRQIIMFHVQNHCQVITRVVRNMDDLVTSDIDGFTAVIQDQMKNRVRMHDLRNVAFHLAGTSTQLGTAGDQQPSVQLHLDDPGNVQHCSALPCCHEASNEISHDAV